MSQWTHVLTPEEVSALYALTESLDPRFARQEREFYETRNENDLRALITGAWHANDADGYQRARSYLALRFPSAAPVGCPW